MERGGEPLYGDAPSFYHAHGGGLGKIDEDPGSVRAKAYDIVLNGTELGGGSVRIFQADVQEKMFEVLGFTKEQAWEQFGFLLNAFKYGVPPHAGLAYGLDRIVMLLTHAESIREVIAFPKIKDASCLMTERRAQWMRSSLRNTDCGDGGDVWRCRVRCRILRELHAGGKPVPGRYRFI